MRVALLNATVGRISLRADEDSGAVESWFVEISEVHFDRQRVEGINNSKGRSVNDTACGARDGSESRSTCCGWLYFIKKS